MAPRPYKRLSTKELKELGARANRSLMQEILDELSHRERKAAVSLRQELLGRLDRLPADNSPTSPQTTKGPLIASITRSSPSAAGKAVASKQPHQVDKDATITDRVSPIPISTKGITPRKLMGDSKPDKRPEAPAFQEGSDPYGNIRAALSVEVDAIRETGIKQSIQLTNGERISSSPDQHLYRFTLKEPLKVPDDMPVTINIGQRSEDGSIVSREEAAVIIALSHDCGSGIAGCQLHIDTSYLVETLMKRFEAIAVRFGLPTAPVRTDAPAKRRGPQKEAPKDIKREQATIAAWNRTLPDILLGVNPPGEDLDGLNWLEDADLEAAQNAAVRASLRHPATLVWGPPGTGKSRTIAALLAELLARGKRTLVVSNTNKAVDSLLEKLAVNLVKLGRTNPLHEGQVVRFGRMSQEESERPMKGLEGSLSDYVIIEGIVERLSHDLARHKTGIIERIRNLELDAAAATRLRAAFLEGNQASAQLEATSAELIQLTSQWETAKRETATLPREIDHAREELANHLAKSFIGKALSGTSQAKLRTRITQLDQRLQDGRHDISDLPSRITQVCAVKKHLQNRVLDLREMTAGSVFQEVADRCRRLEEDLAGPRAELAEVNRQLMELADKVATSCRCLFATATQAYLKPKSFTAPFDVVIIEEATMLTLPLAIYVAGLARQQVVITGDYRQLPAIVSAKDPTSHRWMATDLFTLSGHGYSPVGSKPRLPMEMLNVQRRMDAPICDLINGTFYDNKLKTKVDLDTSVYPAPLAHQLTVIDTSGEIPFVRCKANTFSRYALLNAHVIRNFCIQLKRDGIDPKNIKVMSPYNAQVDVLQKVIGDLIPAIEIGTVHRFQGQEADIVIFDICDSHGLPYLSRFVQSDDISQDGARLLNVAVSRAKRRLVVVGNLPYLEKHLTEGAVLRDILHQMVIRGAVVPCGSIFSARDLPMPTVRPFAPELQSVYTEEDFELAFLADLEKAERYVVIQSAFLTPQRLAGWEPAFRALIARNVRIRIVTRPAANQGSIRPESVLEAIHLAQRIGLVVDLRNTMHQKTAIIDGTVIYHGSLNILSFTGKTEESMLRMISPSLAEFEAKFDTVIRRKTRNGAGDDDLATRENPPCPACANLTVLHPRSRFGPFLRCHDERCAWKCSVDRLGESSRQVKPMLKSPVACPECKRAMVVRSGKLGYFLGCSGYPLCRKTKTVDDDADDTDAEPLTPDRL